uniref:AlNc14C382G11232 protein n=1 Tax=Albugo laibachii Nc14 TaxID=890382 RepID=F0WYH1_9STRA|nr:AlNc14C382G11232 [Albugo laibachii Nc14]|eukprot:CCA26526.1 AlNc14C382G11232 [Albugo laibachii Nc14]
MAMKAHQQDNQDRLTMKSDTEVCTHFLQYLLHRLSYKTVSLSTASSGIF